MSGSTNFGLNLGLTLNIDNISNKTNRLSCYSSSQEEKFDVENELKLFDEINETTTIQCDNLSNPVNTSGSSGTIFEGNTDNTFIKYSDLPYETTKLFSRGDITCSDVKLRINKAINENSNSLKYAELATIFPLNIMKVYNTTRCKNNQGMFTNIIEMEKVNGITLNEFINRLNLELETDSYKLFSCILQLIYITLYANFNGYVHNDLTTNNIMIYEYDKNFILKGLNINKISFGIEFINPSQKQTSTIPVIKFIDFAYSTYIEPNLLNEKKIFGETRQIIKIIKKKLQSINKSFYPLDDIQSILDTNLKTTNYLDNFNILNDYRLLSDNDIINYSLDEQKIKMSITNFLHELENITTKLYPEYFLFNISEKINELKTNEITDNQNTNKKSKNEYYHKYLKYKKKYLELKKNLNN